MVTSIEWTKLDKLENIPDGLTPFRKKKGRIAVYKENGRVFRVFQDNCPHNQKIMISSDYRIDTGDDEEIKITCVYHGACFKLKTGQPITGPTPTSLKIYDFQINEKNELLVNLN